MTDTTGPSRPGHRPVDWRRLRQPLAVVCILGSLVGAIGASLGSVIAGRLAAEPAGGLLLLLAVCIIGGALVDAVAHTLWAGLVDRAEGRLRADLLDAAMSQPLDALSEQAVGEILDRIDDDTYEVGSLLRRGAWLAIRTSLAAGPLWLVAGFTWWPAFVLLPVSGLAVALLVRRMLPEISRLKVIEEAAWTDQAAMMEEGVAARNDLRTSLGQAYLLRRCAELTARVHARFADVLRVEVRVGRRTGVMLHALLAGIAIAGIMLTVAGRGSVSELVTLFLVTTMFVGQVDQLARHLPELQEGFGAVLRLRGMLAVAPEPFGGDRVPAGALAVDFDELDFAYAEGSFALRAISLHVPAGTTCALVGRTGSGKTTLASLVSRAVEPEPGAVRLGGADVRALDLQQLRSAVGVVTQRTEILAGTLAENISLFADLPRDRIESAVSELGLTDWVSGLPLGLDTLLGPGGATLSAGEEQLVAFARLMVRDARVIVLDEATARMDPVTEAHVVRAADRLLRGRTGLLVAHRLSTTERADHVAVLDEGRIVQHGTRRELESVDGPFRRLLLASRNPDSPVAAATPPADDPASGAAPTGAVGTARRMVAAPRVTPVPPAPSLARATWSALRVEKRWGLSAVVLFLLASVTGSFGAATAWVWGRLIADLQSGGRPWLLTAVLAISLLGAPIFLAQAIALYPRWWIAVMLRVRASVLAGQTRQHRLPPTPPGEVVARAMDAERLARYADRWVDTSIGLVIAVITGLLARSWLAGGVMFAIMVIASVAARFGRRVAGRTATASATARAHFGRALVSALESVRTVKLAAAGPDVHRHLRAVDGGRVEAAVREHRIQALLDGVPVVLVQCGVVVAWGGLVSGRWGVATALLVANAVNGFAWFGTTAGAVITEAPGVRSWMHATSALAGGGDLMRLPADVDLVAGHAPAPVAGTVDPLRELRLVGLDAVHEDGTVGAQGVDLSVRAGELILLVGQIGSGKSSLLAALAGLVPHGGEIHWNGVPIADPERQLRPARIAHVAQIPRVLSGTFADNVRLDHRDRAVWPALEAARLADDVRAAGGPDALVGHRGVRLSGGQVQRLALARALACRAEVVLADDVSSALDATTEVELWNSLRAAGATVIGATSKAAALAQADRVVVLDAGRVAAVGPWTELTSRWGHLGG